MAEKPGFQINDWEWIKFQDMPVYLHKEAPNWFVPNQTGHELLQTLKRSSSKMINAHVARFFQRLPEKNTFDYQGRGSVLKLERIRELWFHLTNQCDLSCTHCLFSSSPQEKSRLSGEQVMDMAEQAHALGCRLFVLTGGEPFVHHQITEVIKGLLEMNDTHVVILTNGMNLKKQLTKGRFDPTRLHLQISMDGMEQNHDQIRGKGTFKKLLIQLKWLRENAIPFTLSMSVNQSNVYDMPKLVAVAAETGAGNVHYMWYFVRGRGDTKGFVPVEIIFENLIKAVQQAENKHILIDNLEAMKTQVFAPAGTIHDGTTAAWESLALGPDLRLYPSAALVDMSELATDLSKGLEDAWKNSPILTSIRNSTAKDLPTPFRYIHGGGDLDHCYVYGHTFTGDDPYLDLHEKIALWLISREAEIQPDNGAPGIRLQMGEILESCGAHGKVAFTHSNCLLATAGKNSLTVVKNYYSKAAGDKNQEILNPVCYEADLIDHIPEAYRFRGYGCGSPVIDANIQKGDHVLDLGCGSGVECFIAARITGSTGRVTGIDMLDPMLDLARKGLERVVENLGYNNIQFKKAYLEKLSLESNSMDIVLSNCVMNLSINKRRSYGEIFRVLRPGGRLVISDVVCENEPDPALRNDETLRGECIAGALTQTHLAALLEDMGFTGIRMIKRFPYRTVLDFPFYSLTYSAVKPEILEPVEVIYRGPLSHIETPSGVVLPVGTAQMIPGHDAELLEDQLFVLDPFGNITNVEPENACSCCAPPETQTPNSITLKTDSLLLSQKHTSGCMVCGAPISYMSEEKECTCHYCNRIVPANGLCQNGHFVCDACHEKDGFEIIRNICMNTKETDMIRLLQQIRSHPAMPLHGPEHHALVPGVILAVYKNLGGNISQDAVETGIRRGSSVAGGSCGFMGICGASTGVGIAFSQILSATPVKPKERQIVQKVTQAVLAEIAKFKAARCCQRESWVALKKAAELSVKYLSVTLPAEEKICCEQKEQNRECLGKGCPLY